jgi:hypothetical protein
LRIFRRKKFFPQQSANPQNPKTIEPPKRKGLQGFSANPQTLASTNKRNPDVVLLELAHTLQANPDRLRALLSDDDMQAIAEDCLGYDRANLLAYFRLMRLDGHPLEDDKPEPAKAPRAR